MGRGAIVIGLAAVIIGEVIVRQDLPQLRPEAAGRGHRLRHLLRQSFRRCVSLSGINSNYLKLLSALIVAAVPGRALLEGQVLHQQSA